MSEHNIRVEAGTSFRLYTAGKYCDRDIIITASGTEAGTYDGPSEVTPTFAKQTLTTAGKLVQENIQVHPIPIERVANTAGGYTIIVGG